MHIESSSRKTANAALLFMQLHKQLLLVVLESYPDFSFHKPNCLFLRFVCLFTYNSFVEFRQLSVTFARSDISGIGQQFPVSSRLITFSIRDTSFLIYSATYLKHVWGKVYWSCWIVTYLAYIALLTVKSCLELYNSIYVLCNSIIWSNIFFVIYVILLIVYIPTSKSSLNLI